MIKYLIAITFLSLGFIACKTPYATLQENQNPKHQSGLRKTIVVGSMPKLRKVGVKTERKFLSLNPVIQYQKEIIPIIIPPEPKERNYINFDSSIYSLRSSVVNGKNNISLYDTQKERKGKRLRQVSSNLFLGFLFLAIAVGLAFAGLPSLVAIFALASIIFLVLGFKQLWKSRLKKKKKEKRKEFFKDLFS